MIRIRPYMPSDGDTVLSWCRNEKSFYQWTAGVIGEYPPSRADFEKLDKLMRFTALDGRLTDIVRTRSAGRLFAPAFISFFAGRQPSGIIQFRLTQKSAPAESKISERA